MAILISQVLDKRPLSGIKMVISQFIRNIIVLRVYVANSGSFKYTKQKLKEKGEIDKSIIVIGAVNTLLSVFDKTSSQKFCKDTKDLNNTINQHCLIDIFRMFYPTTIESHF